MEIFRFLTDQSNTAYKKSLARNRLVQEPAHTSTLFFCSVEFYKRALAVFWRECFVRGAPIALSCSLSQQLQGMDPAVPAPPPHHNSPLRPQANQGHVSAAKKPASDIRVQQQAGASSGSSSSSSSVSNIRVQQQAGASSGSSSSASKPMNANSGSSSTSALPTAAANPTRAAHANANSNVSIRCSCGVSGCMLLCKTGMQRNVEFSTYMMKLPFSIVSR